MKTKKMTALVILALGGIMACGTMVRAQETNISVKVTAPKDADLSFTTAKLKNDKGLVAYWNFDEAGESDGCADASGNGYDGTPNTTIKRGEGKFGAHGLSLAGEQVVKVPQTMPFPAPPVSFSAWVKPNTLTNRQYIFTYLPNTKESHHEYEFALHLDNGGEPRFWIWGRFEKGGKQEKWGMLSKTKVTTDEWTHVVVTIGEPTGEPKVSSAKEGAKNLTWTMYQNGKMVATAILPFPPFQAVGEYSIGGKPSGHNSLDGNIDELMVFKKTLTVEEVESLYAANKL